MARASYLRALSAVLIGALVMTLAPPAPPPASANPAGFREVVAVFRIFSAGNARGRVYREARELQGDMDAYYTELRDAARERLRDREVIPLPKNQVAAYLKLVTQIEGERDAATRLIEDEKREARRRFNRTLRRELLGAVIRSPFGQRSIRGVQDVLAQTRAVVAQLRTAMASGDPTDVLLATLEQHIAGIGPLRRVIRSVGGTSGAGLLLQLGRAGDVLTTVVDTARAGQTLAADAEALLGELDAGLQREVDRARRIRSGAPLGAVLDQLFVAVGDGGGVESVAQAVHTSLRDELAALLGQPPDALSERQLGTMRERVRAALLEARTRRIGELADELVSCEKVAGSRFREVVAELGRPEKLARLAAGIPETADDQLYLVCVTIRDDEILSAVLLALEEEEVAPPAGETEVVSETIEIAGTWDMHNIGSDGVERLAYTIALEGSDREGTVDVLQDATDVGTYLVEDGQIRIVFTRTLDLTQFGPWDEESEFAGAVIDADTMVGEYVRQGWSCVPDRDPPCAYDTAPVVFESRLQRRS